MISNSLRIIKDKLQPYDNQKYCGFTCDVPSNKIFFYRNYFPKKTLYHYTTPENCEQILQNGFIGHIISEDINYFNTIANLKELRKDGKDGILFGHSKMLNPNPKNIHFANHHCLDYVSRGLINVIKFEAECIEIYHSSDNQFQYIFNVSSAKNIEKITSDGFDLQKYNLTIEDIISYKEFICKREITDEREIEIYYKIKNWLKEYLPVQFLPATHIVRGEEIEEIEYYIGKINYD
jgi:hypothetical protein